MTRVRAAWTGYFTGVMMALAISLLVQDWLGKEGYKAMVDQQWVNLPWWPWALAMLWALVSLVRLTLKLKKQDAL